jgi:hypothetical protein
MKQITKTIVWFTAFLGIGSVQTLAEPFVEGPYMGQTPPGSTPQIFAPGFISDTRPLQLELCGCLKEIFCGNKNFSV